MRFRVGNAQNIGARPEQQDAFGFSDPNDRIFVGHGGFLGVVADGMGGMADGSRASHAAVRAFLAAYKAKVAEESIGEALSRALLDANRAVVALRSNGSGMVTSGTTLAAAVVNGSELHWVSVGDSRVYLLRENDLIRVTEDHTYAGELNREMARGLISRQEAMSDAQRPRLTSYLGLPEVQQVDRSIRPFALEPADSVIVCTDGFYRAMSEPEMASVFSGDPYRACDVAMQRALAKHRSHQDNLTVIAWKQEGAPELPTASRRVNSGRWRRPWVAAIAFAAGIVLGAGGGFLLGRRYVGEATVLSQQGVVDGRQSTVAPARDTSHLQSRGAKSPLAPPDQRQADSEPPKQQPGTLTAGTRSDAQDAAQANQVSTGEGVGGTWKAVKSWLAGAASELTDLWRTPKSKR